MYDYNKMVNIIVVYKNTEYTLNLNVNSTVLSLKSQIHDNNIALDCKIDEMILYLEGIGRLSNNSELRMLRIQENQRLKVSRESTPNIDEMKHRRNFQLRITSYLKSLKNYEDKSWQSACLDIIPLDRLKKEANHKLKLYLERIHIESTQNPNRKDKSSNNTILIPTIKACNVNDDNEHEFIRGKCIHCNMLRSCNIAPSVSHRQANFYNKKMLPLDIYDFMIIVLLRWFKEEFFKWISKPICNICNCTTESKGYDTLTAEDKLYGARIVEKYQCINNKQHIIRFPRYNHAKKLLETRQGRCGEWSQAFLLCCRSLGYETRMIYDWADHVWVEVYSVSQQRWVHADPCENRRDKPLMYEIGWGKKITYIIAVAKDHVVDVTGRYTKSIKEAISRRNLVSESFLSSLILHLNNTLLAKITNLSYKNDLIKKMSNEKEELIRFATIRQRKLTEAEKYGRISGDKAWKKQRGELGQKPFRTAAAAVASQVNNVNKQVNHEEIIECTTVKIDPNYLNDFIAHKFSQFYGKKHADTQFFCGTYYFKELCDKRYKEMHHEQKNVKQEKEEDVDQLVQLAQPAEEEEEEEEE